MSCEFARFTPINTLLTADLSTTNPLFTGFGIDEIKDYRRNSIIRSQTATGYPTPPYTDTPDIEILATWDTSQKANSIGIFWKNFTVGAKNRLILYDGINQTGDIVYDSGEIEALKYKNILELDFLIDPVIATFDYGDNDLGKNTDWQFNTTIFQSAKIILSNPTNTYGYIDINTVFLGLSIETSNYNFDTGAVWTAIDTTTHITTADGSTVPIKGVQGQEININWSYLTMADRNLITQKIIQKNGMYVAVMVDVYPNRDTTLRSQHFGIYLLKVMPGVSLNTQLSTIGLNMIMV